MRKMLYGLAVAAMLLCSQVQAQVCGYGRSAFFGGYGGGYYNSYAPAAVFVAPTIVSQPVYPIVTGLAVQQTVTTTGYAQQGYAAPAATSAAPQVAVQPVQAVAVTQSYVSPTYVAPTVLQAAPYYDGAVAYNPVVGFATPFLYGSNYYGNGFYRNSFYNNGFYGGGFRNGAFIGGRSFAAVGPGVNVNVNGRRVVVRR
jgi:hypothetical protein